MSDRFIPRQVGVTPDRAFKQAVALQGQGDLAGAEKIFRALLAQYPRHFETLANLGTLLLAAERLEEAAEMLRRALKQQPKSVVVLTALARTLQSLDRDEEALEQSRRAIAFGPAVADAHATLAHGLTSLGRYEDAIRALSRAIDLAPERARFYYFMGHLKRWTANDPRLPALLALAQKSASLPSDEQVDLHFALAKMYADCGDLERAFRHQIEGGKQHRRMFKYDEAWTLRELEAPCRAFDAAWMARHAGVGDPSPLPVFVLGMPRSGTTLVEQILGSHPKVRAFGERKTFNDALAQICGTPTVPPAIAQRAARWSDAELRRLGELYVAAVQRDTLPGVTRCIDKLPANFQSVGLIHAALPNARIIHTCRDPVDTCLSLFSLSFAGLSQLYSYDLGELGRYHRGYQRLMAHWRSILPAGVMLEVQYEDVVDDLEGQARRIVAHCGLEWEDACLEFHKSARPVRTASHAQVRQPIYRTSVGRKQPSRELLLPLLEALGVQP